MTAKLVDVSMFKNAFALRLCCHRWGNHAKGDMRRVSVEANKEKLSLNKRLIECPEYDAVCERIGLTKWEIENRMAVPSYFQHGLVMVKQGNVEMVDGAVRECNAVLRRKLLPELVAAYPEAVRRASLPKEEGGLGCQFDVENYPGIEETADGKFVLTNPDVFTAMFYLERIWLQFSVPDALPESIRAEAEATFKEKVEVAGAKMVDALRFCLSELVDRLLLSVAPAPGKKPMKFTAGVVDNFKAFLAAFDDRNIMQDGELDAVIDRCRKVLDSVESSESLKDDEEAQKRIGTAMTELKGTVDKLVETRPGRAFDLED